MKKILLIALAVILILALCAGCGSKADNSATEQSGLGDITVPAPGNAAGSGGENNTAADFDAMEGWPTSDLPPGFPEYPDGEVMYNLGDGSVYITIFDTNANTFAGYLKALVEFGLEDELVADEDGTYTGIIGDLVISLYFDEEYEYVNLIVSKLEDMPVGAEWPNEIPEYTDGEIDFISQHDSGSVTISVSETSLASVKAYADILVKAGWELDFEMEDGKYMSFIKGKRGVSLSLLPDGTSLSIVLDEKFESEKLPNEWPTALLPSGFPVYPEGEITDVRKSNKGTISITVAGSSEKAMVDYQGKLSQAGWEFEDKPASGLWRGVKGSNSMYLSFSSSGKVNIDVMK